MPTVFPVPLAPGENQVEINLQACHEKVCREGQYGKDIDYSKAPPPPPLSQEDAAWLREVVAT